MLPPTIIPARRRRRHRRRGGSAPVAALSLVAAEVVQVFSETIVVDLTFNTTAAEPLAGVGGAAPAKWTGRYNGLAYTGTLLAGVSYDTLRLTLEVGDVDAGADEINYAANPSDISDSLGRELAAIGAFPL